tara:strand:+ start:197 stop:421 length:225 start_codon:yes stop_codon:yes gene_type:complete
VQAFRVVVGSNGVCWLNNYSTEISKDGSTLSALDHDSGEVSAGEGQDLWWLGLLPIFETGSGHQLPMSLANHHE